MVPYGAVELTYLAVKARLRQAHWTNCSLVNPEVQGSDAVVTTKTFLDAIGDLDSSPSSPLTVWCLEVACI